MKTFQSSENKESEFFVQTRRRMRGDGGQPAPLPAMSIRTMPRGRNDARRSSDRRSKGYPVPENDPQTETGIRIDECRIW